MQEQVEPLPPAMGRDKCPICGRPELLANWVPLYGVRVCWPCAQAFAGLRQVAFLIDCVVLFVLPVAACAILLPSLAPNSPITNRLGWTFYLGISLLFAFKDGLAGMSPGKWIVGLRVVDAGTGRPAGPVRSFLRNLCVSVPLISWLYIWSIDSQLAGGPRTGDDWAGTRVIWRKHAYALPFSCSMTQCRSCGYELTGNVSGRCPECGERIPPDTMRRVRQEMEETQEWTEVR